MGHWNLFLDFSTRGLGCSKVDNAINWINHYSLDKYLENQLHYPRDSNHPVDSTIHLLNKWGKILWGSSYTVLKERPNSKVTDCTEKCSWLNLVT